MVSKRRARKFRNTVFNSWLDDYVYRREIVVYRQRWWLTEAEVHKLVDELALTFNKGRKPTVSLYYSKRNSMGGQFSIRKDGREIMRVRGTGVNRSNVDGGRGVNSKCKAVMVTYHGVPPHLFPALTLLHEFSHYLAWCWWSDGSHHGPWASVNEALQEWFARKHGPKGIAYRVTIKREKV